MMSVRELTHMVPPVTTVRGMEDAFIELETHQERLRRWLELANEIDYGDWTPVQRDVLRMYLIEGLADREIAARRGFSYQRARQVIKLAWPKLRERVPGLVEYSAVNWRELKAGRPRKDAP